jgi:hypothetical protein
VRSFCIAFDDGKRYLYVARSDWLPRELLRARLIQTLVCTSYDVGQAPRSNNPQHILSVKSTPATLHSLDYPNFKHEERNLYSLLCLLSIFDFYVTSLVSHLDVWIPWSLATAKMAAEGGILAAVGQPDEQQPVAAAPSRFEDGSPEYNAFVALIETNGWLEQGKLLFRQKR